MYTALSDSYKTFSPEGRSFYHPEDGSNRLEPLSREAVITIRPMVTQGRVHT